LILEQITKSSKIPPYIIDYIRKKVNNKPYVPNNEGKLHCALLVDNRKNMLSVWSLQMTMMNLPSNWQVCICTSDNSINFYKKYFPDAMFVKHELMNTKFGIETYNKLLKDAELWNQLLVKGFKKCLVCQDDGMLIKPGIERFMEYDYTGSPWMRNNVVANLPLTNLVGNGGLSLRSIYHMHEICKLTDSCKNDLFNNSLSPIPEDVFFSIEIVKNGGKVPTEKEASIFAIEQVFNKDAIGFHKCWAYISMSLLESFFSLSD
jgi:hypothetical protein